MLQQFFVLVTTVVERTRVQGYVVRREGNVLTGVCLFVRWGVPQSLVPGHFTSLWSQVLSRGGSTPARIVVPPLPEIGIFPPPPRPLETRRRVVKKISRKIMFTVGKPATSRLPINKFLFFANEVIDTVLTVWNRLKSHVQTCKPFFFCFIFCLSTRNSANL